MKSSPIRTILGGVSSAKQTSIGNTITTALFPQGKITKTAIDAAKKNFAENIQPWNYEVTPDRLLAFAGKKEGGRKIIEKKIEEGKGLSEKSRNTHMERIDLLQVLMDQPQKYDSIETSDYKPTKSKDENATYYKSKTTEDTLKSRLPKASKTHGSVEDWIKDVKKHGATKYGSVLGNYTIDKGQDEKGHYISYYDKWDLNPIPTTGVTGIDKNIDKAVGWLTKNVVGMTNPEIYGRIYYNPETNEPIDKSSSTSKTDVEDIPKEEIIGGV